MRYGTTLLATTFARTSFTRTTFARTATTAFLFLYGAAVRGADVETVEIPGAALGGRRVKTSVITPAAYAADAWTRYPVVYLLHGAGNDHTVYLQPSILDAVDAGRFIAVAPDGGNDWWLDSPVLPEVRRETFVVADLVPYIDAHYRTLPAKDKRALAGHSMGGQGALRLALRHTDLFGAAGNVMGGVDLCAKACTGRKDLVRVLGAYVDNKDRWRAFSVLTEAANLKPGALRLFTIVGTDDFFLQPNRDLHTLLAKRRLAHEYTEVRGATDELSRHSRPFAYAALARLLGRIAETFAERTPPPVEWTFLRTGAETRVCDGEEASFAPDGRRLVFQRYAARRPRVFVRDLADGAERAVYDGPGAACHPSWTPDGAVLFTAGHETKSAFAAQDDDTGWNLFRWRDGTTERLTRGRAREFCASAAPDGTVYFVSEKVLPTGGDTGVYAGNRTGVAAFRPGDAAPPRRVVVLPDANTGVASPHVSPDGAFLLRAEVADYTEPWRIVLSPLHDTAARTYLTDKTMVAYAPSWRADGRWIVFTGCRAGDDGWHVYLAPRGGGALQRLAKGKNPAFAPDGRSIVYDRDGVIYRREVTE